MDEKERVKQRKKRQRAKNRKKAGEIFLIAIAIIVLALSAFLITLKICDPTFEITSIIPQDKAQQVVAFVKEDVLKQTTTTTTTQTTTKPTTTRPANYDYVEFSDFDFDTSLQGNQVGNLLNNTKGAVTYSASYIYYSIDGDGLYRFEPTEETNAKLRNNNYNFKYLNILGDYIYYVNTDNNKLIRSSNSGGSDREICDDISFAYLYSDKIYFIGTDNSVGYITTSDFQKTVLYTATGGKEVNFVGISLSRIFFTEYDNTTQKTQYVTISITDKSDKQFFRDDTNGDEIKNMELECGYFYYYEKQDDTSYNLIRQKFGSEKTVTLLENCTLTDYPVIYENRLYYSNLSNSTLQAMELNMNSMETKVMVNLGGADKTTTAGVGYGYQYVYLFGKPSESSSNQYRGSCIYTSSSYQNTLAFSSGSWKY
jgi:hypothetical protein